MTSLTGGTWMAVPRIDRRFTHFSAGQSVKVGQITPVSPGGAPRRATAAVPCRAAAVSCRKELDHLDVALSRQALLLLLLMMSNDPAVAHKSGVR